MSIDKALKAKNSGVFIENIQMAFLNKNSADILDAIQKAPQLKWSPETEIKKLGLISWCDPLSISELKSKILHCVEADEFRSAMIGCLFLFGVGLAKDGIDLSEKIFEKSESSSDYEFNASSALSILVDGFIEWEGAPNGKFYISIDKDYLLSTITSIADDFRQSGVLYEESRVIEFAKALAKAGDYQRLKSLIIEYLDTISEYSEIESLIYNFTRTIEGMPVENRSLEVVECEFLDLDLLNICLEKAKVKAKKSDKNSLNELLDYVSQY